MMDQAPQTWSVGEILTALGVLGGLLLYALVEVLRKTFLTRNYMAAFEEKQFKSLKDQVHMIENLTTGNQDTIASNVNRVERLELKLNEIDKYGTQATREILDKLNQMDKRIYRLALKAGVEDDDDE